MAFMTDEQAQILMELEMDYGKAEVSIEHTTEPYGIVWCNWRILPASDVHYGLNPKDRNLFIKPDGSRLNWDKLAI